MKNQMLNRTLLLTAFAISAFTTAHAGGTKWRIQGELSEACSCSVPCSCNFGESPSPHEFCWALFSIDIKKGNFGSVKLDGLHLAGAIGEKGPVWYIDDRATKEQYDALKDIASQMSWKAMLANGVKDPKDIPDGQKTLGYVSTKITQDVGKTNAKLTIGDFGGYESNFIMGIDGKSPVRVQNNWSWNMKDGIKAKTSKMTYKDTFGNEFDMKDTNSNEGPIDWSDSTPIYFR